MFFWDQFAQKGVIVGHAQNKQQFFLVEVRKADHQLSETFYFIKILYVLIGLWIFFYLEWLFFVKKCHFQLRQLQWKLQFYSRATSFLNLLDQVSSWGIQHLQSASLSWWYKSYIRWRQLIFLLYGQLARMIISGQLVGKIIIIILSFRTSTSKNKNADHWVKETCAITSIQVTYGHDKKCCT